MMRTRLERLEGAAIRFLWETVAGAHRPAVLNGGDRECAALLELARKAFFPAPLPFPVLTPEELEAARARQSFDLILWGKLDGARGEARMRPVWHLQSTQRVPGAAVASPLGGWTEDDVRNYLEGAAASGGSGLALHTCGGSGGGKSALVALLASARRAPESRNFLIDDVPGQDRDPRGVVAAASHADVSLVVVDARLGLTTPVRRDIVLLSLLGARRIILAVNKIDLPVDPQGAFARVEEEYASFSAGLKLPAATCLPVSATRGDNVLERSAGTPWYQGPTLLAMLDALVPEAADLPRGPLRLPVEWVFPAGSGGGFRGFAGTIVGGRIKVGDPVRVQPSGRISRVARIVTPAGELGEAVAEQSVAVALDDAFDVARGDLVVSAAEPAEIADQFEATVVWMNPAPLLRGRGYHVRLGGKQVTGTIAPLKHKIDVSTLGRLAGTTLGMNEIGVCNVHLDRDVPFDPYEANHDTGGFLIIDRLTNETAGVGMLHFALRRAQNVHWQALEVNKAARAAIKQQRACVLWYTGLSGAGKSTIANLVDKKLHSLQRHTYLLDGDNVRHGLNKDLGFTDVDRVENIRRIGEVSKLMVDAGLIVSTAFISPFRAERMMARGLLAEGEFFEIHIDTPLGVAEQRDPKGLYKKARRGDLKNFTGIDSPYEAPDSPELRIDTTNATPEEAAEAIVAFLQARGILA
ncbi:MAG TPA: adenylyl-sulfate kinase [Polyangia bacterium]|nr:adenylyl-sulfate kinase [Polyangia bacterium]